MGDDAPLEIPLMLPDARTDFSDIGHQYDGGLSDARARLFAGINE